MRVKGTLMEERKADVSILECEKEVELVENMRSLEHPQAWLHTIPGREVQRPRTYQAPNLAFWTSCRGSGAQLWRPTVAMPPSR